MMCVVLLKHVLKIAAFLIAVGNGIKHVTLRFKLLQNQSSVTCALEAIISVINKVSCHHDCQACSVMNEMI